MESITVSGAVSDNTVEARDQVSVKKGLVTITDNPKAKVRILFIGCSMTKHSPKPSIGWEHDWGMAASEEEKDYVHQTMRHLRTIDPNAAFAVAQTGAWEQQYWKGEDFLKAKYAPALEFKPNVIFCNSTGNNAPKDKVAEYPFKDHYKEMIDFFSQNGRSQVILSTSFYDTPMNKLLREVAAERNYPIVDLVPLGKQDRMKSIGRFEHKGVASHPGDLGMATMAEMIWQPLQKIAVEIP